MPYGTSSRNEAKQTKTRLTLKSYIVIWFLERACLACNYLFFLFLPAPLLLRVPDWPGQNPLLQIKDLCSFCHLVVKEPLIREGHRDMVAGGPPEAVGEEFGVEPGHLVVSNTPGYMKCFGGMYS